jgi:Domain of unknown function (DUF4157)
MGYLHSYAPGHVPKKKQQEPATKKPARRLDAQPMRYYPPEVRERVLQQMKAERLQREAQTKASQTGDKQEEEADRVADHVMRQPEDVAESEIVGPEISRVAKRDDEMDMQRQAQEEAVQESIPGAVTASLQRVRERPGEALPQSERAFFETRFQRDFSRVRIHSGPEAEKAAESVQAKAFTLGRDIVFGRGQYQPGTHEGRRLLAHELTHTVQQGETQQRVQRQRQPDDLSSARILGPGQPIYLITEAVLPSVASVGPGPDSLSAGVFRVARNVDQLHSLMMRPGGNPNILEYLLERFGLRQSPPLVEDGLSFDRNFSGFRFYGKLFESSTAMGSMGLLGTDPIPGVTLFGNKNITFQSKGGEANLVASALYDAKRNRLQQISELPAEIRAQIKRN